MNELNTDETAVETTAVDTPEPEVDESAAEEAADEVELTESVETETDPESEDSDDPESLDEPVTPVDEFSEFEKRYRSEEDIRKLRIPKELKEEFLELTKEAQSKAEVLEEIGGDFGVEAFKPFAKVLKKSAATDDELAEVATALFEANPNVAMQFIAGAAQSVLSTPHVADEYLQNEFGSYSATRQNISDMVDILDQFQVDVPRVQRLLELDKAGLLDVEFAEQEFQTNFEETNLYREMLVKQEEQQRQIAEMQYMLSNPQQFTTPNAGVPVTEVLYEFDQDFQAEVPKKIDAVLSKVDWGSGELAKIVKENILSKLRYSDEFTEIARFVTQLGKYKLGDKRVPMASANLHILGNKAQAMALELVRGVQADMKKVTTGSRNTKTAQNNTPKQKAAGVAMPGTSASLEDRQAKARERFLAALRTNSDARPV